MIVVLMVVFAVFVMVGAWWLLARALNGDETPEAGGSFGDLAFGEKNTRKGHNPNPSDQQDREESR